jgi:hypothetical protein
MSNNYSDYKDLIAEITKNNLPLGMDCQCDWHDVLVFTPTADVMKDQLTSVVGGYPNVAKYTLNIQNCNVTRKMVDAQSIVDRMGQQDLVEFKAVYNHTYHFDLTPKSIHIKDMLPEEKAQIGKLILSMISAFAA